MDDLQKELEAIKFINACSDRIREEANTWRPTQIAEHISLQIIRMVYHNAICASLPHVPMDHEDFKPNPDILKALARLKEFKGLVA